MKKITVTIDKNDNIILDGEILKPYDALILAQDLKELAIKNLSKLEKKPKRYPVILTRIT